MGAGLAEPDGVRVDPFVFVAEPTDRRDGLDGVDVVTRRVGILVCVPSSAERREARRDFSLKSSKLGFKVFANSPLLLRDKFEPCREPVALNGLEFGFELPRDPPGVSLEGKRDG